MTGFCLADTHRGLDIDPALLRLAREEREILGRPGSPRRRTANQKANDAPARRRSRGRRRGAHRTCRGLQRDAVPLSVAPANQCNATAARRCHAAPRRHDEPHVSGTDGSRGELKGLQRKPIQRHIAGIVEYLKQDKILFPNAIILALDPRVKFNQSRGPTPDGVESTSEPGVLDLPILPEGTRFAWIVDGQQRSTALSKSQNEVFSLRKESTTSQCTLTCRSLPSSNVKVVSFCGPSFNPVEN